MQVINSIPQLQDWNGAHSRRPRAVVMTMGALHEGHASLIHAARALVGTEGEVIVTIFVNPTQFSNTNDLANYPSTIEADLEVCRAQGATAVFTPSASDIYPDTDRPKVTVNPGSLADELEGASRAGHFAGVLTVVNKLLALTNAQHAFFGEKDYQQLTLIKHMVSDFNLPVVIHPVATVRADDGVALSSRNVRLDSHQRELAAQIPATLSLVANALAEGHSADEAQLMGREYLELFPEIKLDYLEVRDEDLQLAFPSTRGRVLIAAQIGQTRLIDNFPIELSQQ
jgi:pantoate--beta-alanine ligase